MSADTDQRPSTPKEQAEAKKHQGWCHECGRWVTPRWDSYLKTWSFNWHRGQHTYYTLSGAGHFHPGD